MFFCCPVPPFGFHPLHGVGLCATTNRRPFSGSVSGAVVYSIPSNVAAVFFFLLSSTTTTDRRPRRFENRCLFRRRLHGANWRRDTASCDPRNQGQKFLSEATTT
uniref:Uncharacterized protein n=1 Tax=Anopheles culicifacies TaxID=139723 RepID=A0A182M691_9DIPT